MRDISFMRGLALWRDTVQFSNMAMERLLALIRMSVLQTPPFMERICANGTLTQ